MERIRACRVFLAAVPVVVALSISAVIAFGLLLPGSVHLSMGDEGLSYEVDGMTVEVSGTCVVDSDLPYDVDDLSVTVTLLGVGDVGDIAVWGDSGIRIPAGETVSLEMSTTLYYPALYFLVMETVGDDSSEFRFRIDAECGYMAGLVDIRVVADISFSLSADGGVPEITRERLSESAMVVTVENLNPALMPSDTIMTFSSPECWLEVSVDTGDTLVVGIDASGDLEETLRLLSGSAPSGGVTVTDGDGGPMDMSPSDIDNVLSLISLAVEGTL